MNNSSHSHTFGQDQKKPGEFRTFIIALITAATMVLEIGAGILFGSMALLADGLHMASHAFALTVTLFAYIYARRHAKDETFSFGTGKVNSLGGFTGAILLMVFAGLMVSESLFRFLNPVSIAFNQAIVVALIGLVINAVSVFVLDVKSESKNHHHTHYSTHDHNLRAAYLHVLTDALTSVLAIIALLCAKYFHWVWMDPLMGILGAVLVIRWSWGLLKTTVSILLDRQVSESLRNHIKISIEKNNSDRVADLHVWAIGPEYYSVILSILTSNPQSPDYYKKRLPADLPLVHVTVEVHRI